MSNEQKHTATPWHQDGLVVKDSQNNIIAYIELERSDAARIVQCVNEYDGLIEQIKSLRAERDGLVEALRDIEQFSDIGDGVLSGSIAVVRMKSIATQTIAKYEK